MTAIVIVTNTVDEYLPQSNIHTPIYFVDFGRIIVKI